MEKGFIWLVNPYGNIPGEGWSDYRFSMMAEVLSKQGYFIRWFVASFEHRSKRERVDKYTEIIINENYNISIIPTSSYLNHISIKRILFERKFANNVLKYSKLVGEKPDLIIFAEPALFVTDIYKKLVNEYKSKFLVDIIDLWPEIFISLLPTFLQKHERFIFSFFYERRKSFIKQCNGVVAVSSDYLEVGRSLNEFVPCQLIYWGIKKKEIDEVRVPDSLMSFCTTKEKGEIWLVYAGTLGANYDIKGIISFANIMAENAFLKVKVIIAGDGEMRSYVQSSLNSLNSGYLFYLGRLSHFELAYLYSFCDLAISSYCKLSNVSMPIKAYDYFSYGLPILNSLDRELKDIIDRDDIGVNYLPENPQDMYNSFVSLLANNNRIEVMKSNAVAVAKKFDYIEQYTKLADFISKIV